MRRVADGELRRTRRVEVRPRPSYDSYYAHLSTSAEFLPPDRAERLERWRRFMRLLNQRGEPFHEG